MNRAQKEAFVDKLTQDVSRASAFALMSYSGLKVDQMTSLRLALRRQNISVKVLKNTLAKRAFEKGPYSAVLPQIDGPTIIAISGGDPVSTAKLIWDWAGKEGFNIKIRGGFALGKLMTDLDLKALSRLPGRNELLINFIWAMKCHPTRMLNACTDAPRRLGYALVALNSKTQSAPDKIGGDSHGSN